MKKYSPLKDASSGRFPYFGALVRLRFILFNLSFFFTIAFAYAGDLQVVNLLCNGKPRPLGVGDDGVYFSWQISVTLEG